MRLLLQGAYTDKHVLADDQVGTIPIDA